MNPEQNQHSEPERITMLDGDAQASGVQAGSAAGKGGLDKRNIGKFLAFVGASALALGGLVYVKMGRQNKAQAVAAEARDRPSIARPVENAGAGNVDDFDFNIREQDQVTAVMEAASVPAPAVMEVEAVDEEELARRQQEQAMIAVREKSSLMVQGGSGNGMMSPSEGAQEAAPALPPELQAIYGAMGINMVPGGQPQGGQRGAGEAATQGGRFGAAAPQAPVAHASYTADRRFLMQQGKIIDAVLETAVKSDIPSSIIARTTEDVYGEQGRYPLLPAGTRLFGEYSALVRAGQTEIAAIWRRAITPQGVEIMLDSPGTNNLGIVGMNGRVNNHFFRQFGTAALLSLFGAGAANVGVDGSDRNNSAAQYRTAVADAFADTSRSLLGKYADIPPTITVRHGKRIKVLIAKDLDFSTLLN